MTSPFTATVLPEDYFREIRTRMIFEHLKCDPQVGDAESLSRVVLTLGQRHWREVCRLAEALSREVIAAERELAGRPELLRRLALPRPIRRELGRGPLCAAGPRVMRFDFHFTTDGWRITEVNSDVPGGFIEGSGFTQLVAEVMNSELTTGDPAGRYADALAACAGRGGKIALVHATAYMDDRQVMMFLQRELQRRGCSAILCAPDQILCEGGRARVNTAWYSGAVDLLVRFYPAEWLPNLPRRSGWRSFFTQCQTPQSNPGWSLISQSKRLPLVWDELEAPMETWRELLPQTLDPRSVRRLERRDWVVKPALGRVGDGVLIEGVTPAKEAKTIRRWSRWFPGHWIAQPRFETVPVSTPLGALYPCLGVYTVDSVAAGAYARTAGDGLIDGRASDTAVLIAREEPVDGEGFEISATERLQEVRC